MPSQHSQFGASSAARLLACPGSFGLIDEAKTKGVYTGYSKSSDYADEGTAAHLLAEMCLSSGKEPHDYIGHKINLPSRKDRPGFEVDYDFAEAVAVYVNEIRTMQSLGYECFLEQTVEPAWAWTGDIDNPQDPEIPFDLFGTADCIAYNSATGNLMLVDLKFGRGVLVEVEDNTQLKYYALGALRFAEQQGWAPGMFITTVIVQPRARHKDGPVRKFNYQRDKLIEWGRDVLKPGIMEAIKPSDKFQTGDHCRFCPAALACPEAKKKSLEAARAIFAAKPIPAGVDLDQLLDQFALPDQGEIASLSLAALDEAAKDILVIQTLIDRLKGATADRLSQATLDEIRQLKHVKPVQTPSREVWDASTNAAEFVARYTGSFPSAFIAEMVPPAPMQKQAPTPKQTRRLLKQYGEDPAKLDHLFTTIPGRMTVAPASDPRPVYAPHTQAGDDNILDD